VSLGDPQRSSLRPETDLPRSFEPDESRPIRDGQFDNSIIDPSIVIENERPPLARVERVSMQAKFHVKRIPMHDAYASSYALPERDCRLARR
jgi:hypothetical protein